MFSSTFLAAAFERCLKSAAQTLLALWGAGQLDVVHVDFAHSASVAVGAAVLSLLTSVVSLPIGPDGSPSMVSSAAD